MSLYNFFQYEFQIFKSNYFNTNYSSSNNFFKIKYPLKFTILWLFYMARKWLCNKILISKSHQKIF